MTLQDFPLLVTLPDQPVFWTKVSEWDYKCKMTFNPDVKKQAQEVIFSSKSIKTNHPPVFFNDIPVGLTDFQKHLGMHVDNQLNFSQHIIKEKGSKENKGIGIIRKLNNTRAHFLPFASLLPHLEYRDIIYDQPNKKSFCDKIKRVQYNAALAFTGAVRGSSRSKL